MDKERREPLPLSERVENLKKLVERAYIFYTCWWLYEGAETRVELIEHIEEHSEFYRFDSHAHFCSMIIHCHSILDKSKNATNLKKIASEIGLNCNLTAIEVTHQKIKIIRDAAIGHRSANFSYLKAFEAANVTANEIENYILGCHHFISQICDLANVGVQPPVLNDLPAQHLKALITGNWERDDDWIASFFGNK